MDMVQNFCRNLLTFYDAKITGKRRYDLDQGGMEIPPENTFKCSEKKLYSNISRFSSNFPLIITAVVN